MVVKIGNSSRKTNMRVLMPLNLVSTILISWIMNIEKYKITYEGETSSCPMI